MNWKKNAIIIMILAGTLFLYQGLKIDDATKQTETTQIANPASENCTKVSGRLVMKTRGDGGEYGLCYFEDNRACEEWALLRGECPVGGVKTTGFDTIDQKYCAWSGGETFAVENSVCTLKNGVKCSTKSFYEGSCTLSASDMTSWKTFVNEAGKYEVKYPPEWNVAVNKNNSKNSLFGRAATSESGIGGIENVGTLSSDETLKAFVKKFNAGIESGSKSEVETTVGGNSVIVSLLSRASTEAPSEVKSVSFDSNGAVYNMYISYRSDFVKYPDDKLNLDIFNRMLSAFRY